MKIKTFNKNLPFMESSFLKNLKNLGLLEAGAVVSAKAVENILGTKFEPNDWDFLGKYLTLKTQIEACGFFVTQKGAEAPGFRILKTEEMAHKATKNLQKAMGISFKTAVIMGNHDASTLDDNAKKRYDHTRQTAAHMALAQQKILMDDFLLD